MAGTNPFGVIGEGRPGRPRPLPKITPFVGDVDLMNSKCLYLRGHGRIKDNLYFLVVINVETKKVVCGFEADECANSSRLIDAHHRPIAESIGGLGNPLHRMDVHHYQTSAKIAEIGPHDIHSYHKPDVGMFVMPIQRFSNQVDQIQVDTYMLYHNGTRYALFKEGQDGVFISFQIHPMTGESVLLRINLAFAALKLYYANYGLGARPIPNQILSLMPPIARTPPSLNCLASLSNVVLRLSSHNHVSYTSPKNVINFDILCKATQNILLVLCKFQASTLRFVDECGALQFFVAQIPNEGIGVYNHLGARIAAIFTPPGQLEQCIDFTWQPKPVFTIVKEHDTALMLSGHLLQPRIKRKYVSKFSFYCNNINVATIYAWQYNIHIDMAKSMNNVGKAIVLAKAATLTVGHYQMGHQISPRMPGYAFRRNIG